VANSFYDWFTNTLPLETDADSDSEVLIPGRPGDTPLAQYNKSYQHYSLVVIGQPWWSTVAAVRRSNSTPLIQEAAAALPESDWAADLDWTVEARRVIDVAVRRLRVEHPDAANWLAQEAAK
jgi:hypothetical protein